MDQDFKNLLGSDPEKIDGTTIRVGDREGSITIETAAGPVRFALKPLGDLYDTGVNAATVDPTSPAYMPLCMGIEQRIVECWKLNPDLTDATVSMTLEQLAIRPEAPTPPDTVDRELQLALRLQLTLNSYSRKDVQRCLRVIGKSVARHTRLGGPQGYLTFARRFIR